MDDFEYADPWGNGSYLFTGGNCASAPPAEDGAQGLAVSATILSIEIRALIQALPVKW